MFVEVVLLLLAVGAAMALLVLATFAYPTK